MMKSCDVSGLALMLCVSPPAGQSNAALPADIQAAIRKDYVMPGTETRYLDESIDLNADGKSYPANPTVANARVKPATAPSGDVIIKAFTSCQEAKPLPAGASAPQAGSGPSFDCAKASLAVEKAVCADAGLSTLDRALGDAYSRAMREWPETTKVKERAAQRDWATKRNDCAKANDVKACLDGVYRRRMIEVQITSGQLTAPTPVSFVCEGRESQPFTIAYYNQTDPKSAVMTMGNRQAVLLSAPSGSGARYTGTDAEFWEHQGEATVAWARTSSAASRASAAYQRGTWNFSPHR